MKRRPKVHHGGAAVILRNQDQLQIPGAKHARVPPAELDAIEARADPADIPRLIEEIRTLRSFIEVGLAELELYEEAEKKRLN